MAAEGRGMAPGPILLIGVALCTLAFGTDQPLVLAALAASALMLHLAAPRPNHLMLVAGAAIGVGIMVLNPFVQANGDLILFTLPDIPVLDTQVTLEEVVAGAAMGARAFAVTVIIGAVLAHADPDRLLALAGRLAPRSALTASIAARLLPTLERDAQSLVDTMRLRGRSPRHGRWHARARAAGALAIPLTSSALDRSLDVAEAMAARAYGSGRTTRLPSPGWTGAERTVAAAGALALTVAVTAIAGRLPGYAFYPTLDPMLTPPAAAVAALTLAAAGLAAWSARR